jgi:pimeloyl-ACP methyl ester carboxylesterase
MSPTAPNAAIDHRLKLPGRGETTVRDIPGPPGAPTVVLLHGLGATGRLNWGRCFRPLSEHFRVISLDHRGHGRGLRTRRFRLEECADDAVAAAEALGAMEFIAVGYSMGGPIASLAWRRHPKHVSGLVLCATSRHFARRGMARLARAGLPVAALGARFVPGLVQRGIVQRMLSRIEHPQLRDRVKEDLFGHDPASIIQATEAVSGFSSHDWIGKVDVPTAVVVTTLDDLVPVSRQRKLAASIPGALVFEIAGDHYACAADPDFPSVLVSACRAVGEAR